MARVWPHRSDGSGQAALHKVATICTVAAVRLAAVSLLVAVSLGGCSGSPSPPASEPPVVDRECLSRSIDGCERRSLTTVPAADAGPGEDTLGAVPIEPSGLSAGDLCRQALRVEPVAELDTELLPETSGAVYSRATAGRLYAHNDSGSFPRLHAIDGDSRVTHVWTIDSALFDWEDIAIAGSTLFLADIGDDLHIRPTVRILAVPEPPGETATLSRAAVHPFTYAEGRLDAEAVLVDIDGTEAVVITKGIDFPSGIYRIPLQGGDGDATVLERVADFTVGEPVSGADLSADGAVVAVRTPTRVLLFDRAPGADLAESLSGTPCEAPSAPERQGEAIALHPDGRGYTTLSARESTARHEFRVPIP